MSCCGWRCSARRCCARRRPARRMPAQNTRTRSPTINASRRKGRKPMRPAQSMRPPQRLERKAAAAFIPRCRFRDCATAACSLNSQSRRRARRHESEPNRPESRRTSRSVVIASDSEAIQTWIRRRSSVWIASAAPCNDKATSRAPPQPARTNDSCSRPSSSSPLATETAAPRGASRRSSQAAPRSRRFAGDSCGRRSGW